MEKNNKDTSKLFFLDRYTSDLTDSERIIATPSYFAKNKLFYIQEIGTLKSLKKHTSRRKTIDSFLVVMIIEGKGVFHQNETNYYVKTGDVLFLNCKHAYYHISDEDFPWKLNWLHFNGPNIEQYNHYFTEKFNSVYKSTSNISKFTTYFNLLNKYAKQNNIETEFRISNLINNLITELLIASKNDKTKFSKIDEIKNYLNNNFYKKITLDELSKEFYISKYHMSREFKATFGMTINTYITNRKITYCKELLRFSDLNIEEIGVKAGINDSSYFNKLFKKIEDVTPSEYRKKWTGK